MSETKVPEIIYKYRDWRDDCHKRMLTNQEIFLASPKDLNDPFDCRVTASFDLLDTDEKVKEYLRVIGERNKEKLKEKHQTVDEYVEEVFQRLKSNRQEQLQTWDDEAYQSQDEKYGVFSLSARWDSILMWGHYSAAHTGLCVGFYERELHNSGHFGKGGFIHYDARFPQIHPNEDYTPERGFIETFTKAKDWAYEEEYRFFKFLKSSHESRSIFLHKTCYAEIILGLHFPKQSVAEIEEHASKLNVPLYVIVKVPGRFQLDRVKIN